LKNAGKSIEDCLKGDRQAFSLIQKAYIPYQVFDRFKLFAGAELNGPAIIEEKESTIIVGEDARASVDEYGFVWINLNAD
jgi:N-methylhydantoinase A